MILCIVSAPGDAEFAKRAQNLMLGFNNRTGGMTALSAHSILMLLSWTTLPFRSLRMGLHGTISRFTFAKRLDEQVRKYTRVLWTHVDASVNFGLRIDSNAL